MARITPKQAKEMLNAYSDVYTDLEENARERMRKNKERITNPFGNVTIEKEDGTKLKQGDKGFDQELDKGRDAVTKANNDSLKNRGGNSNNNSSSSSSSDSGVTRTVTKNDDGKGVTVTKKDLDSETENLISNTKTVKNSKFSGKDAKADLGSYKSIFDKGNNSNAKGNSIGGNTEGGPKGNPISTQSNNNQSNNNQPGSGSRQVKPGLIGRLLPNHPGNNQQQQTGNNQQQTGNNQQARPGRTVGAPQGSGKPGSMVRVQGNQNRPNLGDRIKSGINRLGNMAANTISRAKTSLSNQGPIQGRQTGVQRRTAQTSQTAQRTQQTGNNNHPSTAEIRAKAKASGQSGLSNIPSKEGNAVINNKPINPDFGKKPVVQSTGAKVGGDGGRAAWLKKTANSPAARSGAFSDDQRWAQRQKHLKFQADRKAAQGAKQGSTPQGTPVKTQQPLNNSYESIGDYFDETIHFLVSEGHVQNESEAISIMSTPEFISGFEKGLNESFENNK